jgi:hypothetical protein
MTVPREFLVLLSNPENDGSELGSFVTEDLQFIDSATLVPGESGWVVCFDEITPAYLRDLASAAKQRQLDVRFALRDGAEGDWVANARTVIDTINRELDAQTE